jgi:hypothetical protein
MCETIVFTAHYWKVASASLGYKNEDERSIGLSLLLLNNNYLHSVVSKCVTMHS